jgi:hypothetical protein
VTRDNRTWPKEQKRLIEAPTLDLVEVLLGERSAFYRARDKMLEDAWTVDPEFENALNQAYALRRTEPLEHYVASDKPLTRYDRLRLSGLIRLLRRPRRGRPRNLAKPSARADDHKRIERDALYNAYFLVCGRQLQYRREHSRQRVPQEVTDTAIREVIQVIYKASRVRVNRRDLRKLVYKKGDELEPTIVHSVGSRPT